MITSNSIKYITIVNCSINVKKLSDGYFNYTNCNTAKTKTNQRSGEGKSKEKTLRYTSTYLLKPKLLL